MNNKKFTLVAVTGLLVSQLVFAPIAGAAPQNPQDIKPADYADNVSLNPTLGAVVSDTEGKNLKKVEFLQGNVYDFSASDKITAFQQTTKEDPLTVTGKENAVPFTAENNSAAAFADNKHISTAGKDAFPAQRFEVAVAETPVAGEKVEIYWEGQTSVNGVINLSAWNYTSGKWEVLKKADGNKEEADMILKAEVDPANFLSGGKIQAMVHDASPAPVSEAESARMLWFTDTQFYTQDHPEVWDSMTDWMIAEYEKGSYEYVFHTGDIVQTPTVKEEWAVANKNFGRLEAAGIPYGVVSGNHDVKDTPTSLIDYSHYWEHFGSDRFENNHWYGGHMDNNRNHYDLITAGGEDFIMMYLGYGTEATDETVAWASEVLTKYSDRSAILALHWYITPTLTYPTTNAFNVNEKIVKRNENIKMVLSGHYLGAAHRSVTHKNADGTERQVLEVLANYQGSEYQSKRGGGYLRMIDFKPTSSQVSFSTYSPYLKDYNYYTEEQDTFTESFQFENSGTPTSEANRSISTDYFGVNIFKGASIGKAENVVSGKRAEVQWKDLAPQKQYFWYMKLTDASDETKWTKINRFKTGDEEIPVAPSAPLVDPVNDKDQKVSGSADSGTVITVNKGTVELGRSKTNADGKYEVAIPAQPAGTVISVTATSAKGLKSKATDIKVTASPVEAVDVNRVSGDDRYKTAIAISQDGWKTSDTVILTTGADFPDALAGVPLAHKMDAPILLTRTKALNAETKAEISRLNAKNIIILGGPTVVSSNIEAELGKAFENVTRIAGETRYETAAMIAEEIGSDQAVIVQGLNFPDVLAISPYAAKNGIPILMTRTDRLPAETSTALKGVVKTYVIGGKEAVSDEVMAKLPKADRYGGETRFETAKEIITKLQMGTDKAYAATGMEFPDALAGGVMAARNNAPILLVKKDEIPAPMKGLLPNYDSFTVFGGPTAISEKVVDQLKAALQSN